MRDSSLSLTRRTLMGGAAALAIAVPLAPARALDLGKRGGTLTIGLPYDQDTLNPFSTGFLPDVASTVIEGLIAPDQDAKYFPVLATEVPTVENGAIKVSADGKKMDITFKLRPNVKWNDGEPFTADDIRFTWMTVKDPAFIAESKDGVNDIDSIETPDPLTAIVHYNTVNPTWPISFVSRGILPKHRLEGKDLNKDPFNEKPVGTGPFMVTEWKRGQYAVLDRNPYYWRTDSAGTQLPYLDKMVFNFIPDLTAMATRLRAGDLMFAYNFPFGQMAALQTAGFEIVKNPILSWQHLDFNFKGPAPLRDVAVRQAVAYAINRDACIRSLNGVPIPIKSVVSPQFDYYDPDIKTYGYEPEKAKQLLEGAGYKMGSDGIRTKGDDRLSFRIMVQAGSTIDETLEQVVMANLKAVGIELKPDNKAGVAFRDSRYKGLYDIYMARWITGVDPAYSSFFGSKGPNNGQGYSDSDMDALLFQAEHTIDRKVMKDVFKKIQAKIADEVITIPIVNATSLIAKTAKLKNFVPNPTNRTIFNNTSGWFLT